MVCWIIIGFMVITAMLGGYFWLNQSEPRPIPPAGWQTIHQDTLIVSLPPEYIVLNPNLASANLDFTKTYSGTYETLTKITNAPVKIDFLAVNPENGDTIVVFDKTFNKNSTLLSEQLIDISDLMSSIRNHNQQTTDTFVTSRLITKYDRELDVQKISESNQNEESKNIFELIGQNIVLEDD
ncbi:hypothetical protein Haur_4451 [Herpetosiphon aurantiacus DSM 785]|uniref:Uncharacterized protein n=2 Tax=Herpetosiphon TaxID=64 RepID=A9AZM9_HERA2|nr:hypothetical protein Haur_4451 [Herpetosiphon aurantiacus DSM 785]